MTIHISTQLIRDGIDVVKKLYQSKDNHIKVRALVAMCKMGMLFEEEQQPMFR